MLQQTDKLQMEAKKRIEALEYSLKCCEKDYSRIGEQSTSNMNIISVLSERKNSVSDDALKNSIHEEMISVKIKTKKLLELFQIYLDTRNTVRKLICLVNLFYQQGFYDFIIKSIPNGKILYKPNKTNKINKLCKLYSDLCKAFQSHQQYDALFKEEYLNSINSIEIEDGIVRKSIEVNIYRLENIYN